MNQIDVKCPICNVPLILTAVLNINPNDFQPCAFYKCDKHPSFRVTYHNNLIIQYDFPTNSHLISARSFRNTYCNYTEIYKNIYRDHWSILDLVQKPIRLNVFLPMPQSLAEANNLIDRLLKLSPLL